MPNGDLREWGFLDAVSVSAGVVSEADSVVILSDSAAQLHGGWVGDVDLARSRSDEGAARRVRVRPARSNQQFRVVVPRGPRARAVPVPAVRAVRIPAPGESGSSAVESKLFWVGMQLVSDTYGRVGEKQGIEAERLFRCACGAASYARSAGVGESLIRESLADAAELAEILMRVRDSVDVAALSAARIGEDDLGAAVGFLAAGLPSAVTIEMREQQ